jgi:hypothetical protein
MVQKINFLNHLTFTIELTKLHNFFCQYIKELQIFELYLYFFLLCPKKAKIFVMNFFSFKAISTVVFHIVWHVLKYAYAKRWYSMLLLCLLTDIKKHFRQRKLAKYCSQQEKKLQKKGGSIKTNIVVLLFTNNF